MNPKLLTDYERMLLGISRRLGEQPRKERDAVVEQQPSPLSPTTSVGLPSPSQDSGLSIDEVDLTEYVAYLNSLIKRGAPF